MRNRLSEFAQIRGNLTDNAVGNPEPRFAEGILKLKYSKNDIQNIVKDSRSKRECLIKLNLKPYGGNYRVLEKYIDLYNINTDHFLGQGWNVGNTPADVIDPVVSINVISIGNKLFVNPTKFCIVSFTKEMQL